MTGTKYKHLVKQLEFHEGPAKSKGGGNADWITWPKGSDLAGMNLNFTWGFYSQLGDWHPGRGPHTHPYPECLVFVGLDPTDITYLGAEIEIAMGEEGEKHVFNQPTVCVIPAGFPHCPVVTRKVDSPKGFGFYLISLSPEVISVDLGPEAIKDTEPVQDRAKSKYGHLVKLLRGEMMEVRRARMRAEMEAQAKAEGRTLPDISVQSLAGPANADQLIWLYGEELEGLPLNFTWGYYSKCGIWHRGHGAHVHPADEVLVFVGLDPTDPNYLGAELEIDMGAEHESYVFNTPTVVICPGQLPHLPLITRWCDKPYSFYVIGLDASHESPWID